MNRAEILAKWDAMTPRERDAWVANSVMNIKGHLSDYIVINRIRYDCKTWIDEGWTADNPPMGIYPGFLPEPYSEKIEAAFEVVEKVHSMLFSVRRKFLDELQKIISIEKLTGLDRRISWPDVFWYITPEKICKAALLAVGVE